MCETTIAMCKPRSWCHRFAKTSVPLVHMNAQKTELWKTPRWSSTPSCFTVRPRCRENTMLFEIPIYVLTWPLFARIIFPDVASLTKTKGQRECSSSEACTSASSRWRTLRFWRTWTVSGRLEEGGGCCKYLLTFSSWLVRCHEESEMLITAAERRSSSSPSPWVTVPQASVWSDRLKGVK